MHVWIKDWTPSGTVTVSLYTVTAGQHVAFTTSGCHKRSSCTIPAPGKTPATLHAEVTAKHSAHSITVKAVGDASAAKLSQPLSVSESVQFILPKPAPDVAPTPTLGAIEPVPLPTLSSMSHRTLVSPGNASGLFPSIVPSATPTASPVTYSPTPARTRSARAVEVLPVGMTMGTAQVIGIVAIVMAICVAALAKLLPGRRTK